jgi:hypothetical protein
MPYEKNLAFHRFGLTTIREHDNVIQNESLQAIPGRFVGIPIPPERNVSGG